MAYQARQFIDLATSRNLTEACRHWPELSLGSPHQFSLERLEWLDMLRRYGMEWNKIVSVEPALAARLGWTAGL